VYSIKIYQGKRYGNLETTQRPSDTTQEQCRVGAVPIDGDNMLEPDDIPLAHVREHIIATHPKLAADTSLRDRLARAYTHAVELGFTDGDAIARFLRYEASAPSFYRQPAIDNWLRQPGQPVELRFADVLARVTSRLRRD
jgi:hypothetical protein